MHVHTGLTKLCLKLDIIDLIIMPRRTYIKLVFIFGILNKLHLPQHFLTIAIYIKLNFVEDI